MPPTPQQARLIAHDHTKHGRAIAGPGTGKSWTAIELLQRVRQQDSGVGVGLLTFTRAATTELIKKAGTQGLDWLRPATVHSYALRLLMRSGTDSGIALPLRIPDTWESKELIRSDLARRLRASGHKVTVNHVAQLEREMSAQWDSLDETLELLSDVDPALRNAYVGRWSAHRRLFRYALLAEIPFRAGQLLEDFDPDIGELGFLIVDEYQDLNRADIRLLIQLARRGVKILAIGDDDQSIYGFRMAAPAGIIEFPSTFGSSDDYPLTVSMRCGGSVLEPATALIETASGRVSRPRLAPREGLASGEFAYLRFDDQLAEARAVARLIRARIATGVAPRDIAVLVRSSVDTWAALLQPELAAFGIPVVDSEWVTLGLADESLRFALATARLAVDERDSLAWWTLLHLTRGVTQQFIDYIADSALPNESFGDSLLKLCPNFTGAPSATSSRVAASLVQEQLTAATTLKASGPPTGPTGWGDWIMSRVVAGTLSDNAVRLLEAVGAAVPVEDGLASFLGQLEPLGKDFALQSEAVRIMSMSSSKGLTVDSAFVMGVEAGIVPHPNGTIDEDRRLLYVAMTRATSFSVLTAAKRRTGPTARHGTPNVNQPRGRSPLLADLPIGNWLSGEEYLAARGL